MFHSQSFIRLWRVADLFFIFKLKTNCQQPKYNCDYKSQSNARLVLHITFSQRLKIKLNYLNLLWIRKAHYISPKAKYSGLFFCCGIKTFNVLTLRVYRFLNVWNLKSLLFNKRTNKNKYIDKKNITRNNKVKNN